MASGDEVADREARERFVGAYDAKHNVIVEGEKASLVVGSRRLPVPDSAYPSEGRLEVRYGRRPA